MCNEVLHHFQPEIPRIQVGAKARTGLVVAVIAVGEAKHSQFGAICVVCAADVFHGDFFLGNLFPFALGAGDGSVGTENLVSGHHGVSSVVVCCHDGFIIRDFFLFGKKNSVNCL